MRTARRRRFRLRWIGLLVLVGLAAAYIHFTRPDRLRAALRHALRAVPAHFELGDVSFSPAGVLRLTNVVVTPEEAKGNKAASGTRWELRLARAGARCDLRQLLQGRLRVDALTVERADLRLVLDRDSDAGAMGDRGILSAGWRFPVPVEKLGDLPVIQVREADVQLLLPADSGPQLLRRWRVSASAYPSQQGYRAELTPLADPGRSLLTATWEASRRRLLASSGWFQLDAVIHLLPRSWRERLDSAEVQGRIRLAELVLTDHAGESAPENRPTPDVRRVTLELSEAGGALPLEADLAQPDGAPPPAPQRFVQVRAGELRLVLERDDRGVSLRLAGRGEVNGAPARLDLLARPDGGAFDLDDLSEVEFEAVGLPFPPRERQPGFVHSPRLPRAIRYFLNDFKPEGTFDLRFHARRESAPGEGPSAPLRLVGEMSTGNARCRHRQFPYEFESVRGCVRFTPDAILLDGLTARHGSARIEARGRVEGARHAAGFDLTFSAVNVPLDEDLYAALPERYRKLWQQAAPLGTAHARVRLQREHAPRESDPEQPTRVTVAARLLAGSLRLDGGRRLRAADGRLTIADDVITLHELHGYLDEAAVRLAGSIRLMGERTETRLRIAGRDVPIVQDTTLGANDGETARVHFAGIGDVWGCLRGTGLAGGPESCYVVHIKDGSLTGFDPDQRWEGCTGWVSIHGDSRRIHTLTASQGPARLRVSGTFPGACEATPADLSIEVTDAAMENLPAQLVPPRWLDEVTALGLGGAGNVSVALRPDAADDQAPAADIDLTAARMEPTPLPVPLASIAARGTIARDRLEVTQVRGRYGPAGEVSLSGRLSWHQGRRSADFDLQARDLDLSPELVNALPERLALLLQRLDAQGRLTVALDHVRFQEDGQPAWRFDGRLALQDAHVELGLPLSRFQGELNGTCTLGPGDALDLYARIAIRQGLFGGRPIADWSGEIVRRADNPWVSLENLRGKLCGGDAIALIRINPDTTEYELSLTFQDVRLAEAVPARNPDTTPPRRAGFLDGRLFLRGRAGETASRTGGGELRLRGAYLLQTPIVAEVAEARPEPLDEPLDSAELRFVWQGSRLELTRVDLNSRNLRLVGTGTWNLDTDAIALLLVGAHPRDWPRVPLLTDVLETTGRELVQYHVGGTLSRPQVKAEPLHRLNAALRALLSGTE